MNYSTKMEATFHMPVTNDNNNTNVLNFGRLHSYLKQEYEKHKFPFFNIGKLYKDGVFDKDEANILWGKGIIRKRKGFNQTLIEYLGEQSNE